MAAGTQLVSATAPGAAVPLDSVRELLTDGAALSGLCDQVLAIVPDGDGWRWCVLLNGSEVGWRLIEKARHPDRLEYIQTEGDLAALECVWLADDRGLTLDVHFNLGVDGLAPLLDPIWGQSLHAFADAVVHAVAAAVTSREESS
ncbi:MAG TPA: hypothetical protein VFM37_04405 [Pseudonocardiaceae bacterium]|nr:hypothetical protein [Pseudonocardiaceae bacterium]